MKIEDVKTGIVVAKRGGPPMTVETFTSSPPELIICVYYDGLCELHRRAFRAAELERSPYVLTKGQGPAPAAPPVLPVPVASLPPETIANLARRLFEEWFAGYSEAPHPTPIEVLTWEKLDLAHTAGWYEVARFIQATGGAR